MDVSDEADWLFLTVRTQNDTLQPLSGVCVADDKLYAALPERCRTRWSPVSCSRSGALTSICTWGCIWFGRGSHPAPLGSTYSSSPSCCGTNTLNWPASLEVLEGKINNKKAHVKESRSKQTSFVWCFEALSLCFGRRHLGFFLAKSNHYLDEMWRWVISLR